MDGSDHDSTRSRAKLQADKIGRIAESTGAITEYQVPTASAQPQGIGPDKIVEADGAMWFTEHNARKIGRITTH